MQNVVGVQQLRLAMKSIAPWQRISAACMYALREVAHAQIFRRWGQKENGFKVYTMKLKLKYPQFPVRLKKFFYISKGESFSD